MARQSGVGGYPQWRRAFWRLVAGLAYGWADACWGFGGWAMGHLPECRLNRERYQRIWSALSAKVATDGTEADAHDHD